MICVFSRPDFRVLRIKKAAPQMEESKNNGDHGKTTYARLLSIPVDFSSCFSLKTSRHNVLAQIIYIYHLWSFDLFLAAAHRLWTCLDRTDIDLLRVLLSTSASFSDSQDRAELSRMSQTA